MKYLFFLSAFLMTFSSSAQSDQIPSSLYWRFEGGQEGSHLASDPDETGKHPALPGSVAPVFSNDVPMAIISSTGAANHSSLKFEGGACLHVPTTPELNEFKNFTVEMWVKTESPTSGVLASKGVPGPGNWHIIMTTDGKLRANIFGGAVADFLGDSGALCPGVWYHLAATYEDIGAGRTRIRSYLNGNLRSTSVGAALQDTSGTDLFIGSYPGGDHPFTGMIDEFRFTPSVLKPAQFLIKGEQEIVVLGKLPDPIFVPAGTKVDDALIAKAKTAPILTQPDGYSYFYSISMGQPAQFASVPKGFGIGYSRALKGWSGGCPVGYHFAVKPGAEYVVAIGFYEPTIEPKLRKQNVVLDGRVVDTFDLAAECVQPDGTRKPFVRKYQARDENGDGYLEVSCCDLNNTMENEAKLSQVWIFPGANLARIDTESLLHNPYAALPAYYVSCGRENQTPGHIKYPPLSAEARTKMLPNALSISPTNPRPPDPWDITLKGDLAARISTYLDRWGYSGRDQRLVARHLPDCGFEVTGRNIDTISKLARLTHRDFDMQVPFEELLTRQDHSSKFPGSFIGGDPVRTGFIWGQGTLFTGLMEYYDMTGDKRALESASKLADWYQSYLSNGDLAAANYFSAKGEFSREGATVGHLGKGALEGITWLYLRTKNPKHLEIAKQMAELNRQWGGVAWMIHGDIPEERQQYEGWHIHANLSTVRGFVWLYAATGDRSYLDDAIAACDRIDSRATWGSGGVPEQIPWASAKFPGPTPDPHDEVCQTADQLMLSYLLAETTGEGRFYDRAEKIYFNHIRYMQMHYGDFTAFNRLPGPGRGGDAWFCCGWWGAKALYETARHIFASSPKGITINGFLPSSADLKVGDKTVKVDLEADLPNSGNVKLTLHPQGIKEFDINIRVPSWAKFQGVKVNGSALQVQPWNGYITLNGAKGNAGKWSDGDVIDVLFDLPLRVVLDSAWDTLPTAKASLNDLPPAEARCVSIFKGPIILAQFRLNSGVDLGWTYTSDHPDLLDTMHSVSDIIEGADWKFESNSSPALTKITQERNGVRLQWEFTPQPGWTLKRTVFVHDGVPVKVDCTAQLIAPSEEAAKALKSARLCGVRMHTTGFVDYAKPKLFVNDKETAFSDVQDTTLPAGKAKLDNGYVQFAITSNQNGLTAVENGDYDGVYATPVLDAKTLTASCTLEITGQNQWEAIEAK